MTHYMNLHPQPFSMIACGAKTIELRLLDEKRKLICVGDTLVFKNTQSADTLSCTVKELHVFANFDQLYKSLPLDQCGYLPHELKTASAKDMQAYYPLEKQAQYGVVGIEIELNRIEKAIKKLLITGFDPFDGASINPSWEAVKLLPEQIGDWRLTKLEIPTVFGLAAQTVLDAANDLQPDAILCVGQAGGRDAVTPETYGVNLRHARIADNAGNKPLAAPIVQGAPASYPATVPVHDMVRAVRKLGIPCKASYSAGRFVCNDVLYTLLHHYHGTNTKVGFVHIPYLPEQAKEGTPSLMLESAADALYAAIKVL